MKKIRTTFIYALFDLAGSASAWTLFSLVRGNQDSGVRLFFAEYFIATVAWLFIFMLTGFYSVSLKRSRLMELFYSVAVTLPVSFLICFVLLMGGFITEKSLFLRYFTLYFVFQFVLTYFPRLTVTSVIARKVHKGLLGYRTIIIGSNGLALDIFRKIKEEKIPAGNLVNGYVTLNRDRPGLFGNTLQCLGIVDDLPGIIASQKIEEVIIAIEGNEHDMIGRIIGMLNYSDVTVKAIPSLTDILTGRVEHTSIFGTPLLEVPNRLLPVWQSNFKQMMDYLIAVGSILILSPIILILAILIKLSGPGPVIYSQERTGKNGKPFTIYKLRSMTCDAERGEPLLSSRSDPRVTRIGRFMRRHRLDEIPNLINVLKGEMSLVGPRPERQYFIDQIVVRAPHYRRLLKVKPGITSWGQVKFGYASDVGQMIERLEYDLLYLDNMSLFLDLKIIIYTALIIIYGKGV